MVLRDMTAGQLRRLQVNPTSVTTTGSAYVNIQGDGDIDLSAYKEGTRTPVADWKNIVHTKSDGQFEIATKQQVIDTVLAYVTNNYSTTEQVWHGQKFLTDETIYWKTFETEAGNNENWILTDVLISYTPVKVEAGFFNIINGHWEGLTSIELDDDFDANWSIFLTNSVSDIKLTIWYTKP